MLMILACHFAAVMLPQSIARLMTPLGGIGVAVFLVISGYGNNESYLKQGTRNFWKKKLLSVVIPYIVAFLVYQVLAGLFLDFNKLIRAFLFIEATYYWYIGYQILWYLLFYLAVRFSKSLVYKYIVLSAAAVISFVLLNEIRAEQSFSFLFGVLLSDFKEIKPKIQKRFFVISVFVLGILCLTIKQLSFVRSTGGLLMKLVQLFIKLPLGIFILIFLAWLMNFSFMNIIKKTLAILGDYSYEIYLAHCACISLVLTIAPMWLGACGFMVTTVIMTLLLRVVSDASNKMINKR